MLRPTLTLASLLALLAVAACDNAPVAYTQVQVHGLEACERFESPLMIEVDHDRGLGRYPVLGTASPTTGKLQPPEISLRKDKASTIKLRVGICQRLDASGTCTPSRWYHEQEVTYDPARPAPITIAAPEGHRCATG